VSHMRSESVMGVFGALCAEVVGMSVQDLAEDRTASYLVACSAVRVGGAEGLELAVGFKKSVFVGLDEPSALGLSPVDA